MPPEVDLAGHRLLDLLENVTNIESPLSHLTEVGGPHQRVSRIAREFSIAKVSIARILIGKNRQQTPPESWVQFPHFCKHQKIRE